MNPLPKSLSVFYFFGGLLVGLLIGLSVSRELSAAVAKIVSAGLIILFSLSWRRIESLTRKRYLESWSFRRAQGKWRFILTHYVLIKGTIIYLAVSAPMIPALVFTTENLMIILSTIVLLAFLMVYLGHEVWTQCEEDYTIKVLREAAERSRIASN